MRIIITGSRTWTSRGVIAEILLPILAEHPDAVLVHGDAAGADSIARDVWRAAGGKDDPFPIRSTEWRQSCRSDCDHGPRPQRPNGSSYCPSPGPRRNQRMADSGADLCVGFRMPGKSTGADDMLARAHKAKIPVQVYSPDYQPALF